MTKKTFNFAHLMGFGKSASEEDEDKKAKKAKARKAEEDERDEDAEDDDERDDAEDDDRDEDAEDHDGDDGDPDAEEDDGDDGKKKDGKAARQARASERKRCARIFGSKHAAANPALAASLAFNTGMSSAAAIGVLASSAPAKQPQATHKRSLDQRMQENQVRLAPDGGKSAAGKSALVEKMTGLYNSTTGDK
ncbi:hypothetical protein AI3057V1_1461 [Citrobacter freundii]|uniref:hypothetical protein n=1 Tax=Citrobacter freundii TaxID=546 RepID=UPI001D78DEC4|nr:hypothetical protein [Citrobacter freundii]CAG0338765.1 hypothetical protein AI3057V1_1461 [Citrobacter freundii]CAH6019726.1 hypothetical protein AI3057V1_1461 [Citrobacter freundii]